MKTEFERGVESAAEFLRNHMAVVQPDGSIKIERIIRAWGMAGPTAQRQSEALADAIVREQKERE